MGERASLDLAAPTKPLPVRPPRRSHRHVGVQEPEQGRRRITENKRVLFLLLGDSDIDSGH